MIGISTEAKAPPRNPAWALFDQPSGSLERRERTRWRYPNRQGSRFGRIQGELPEEYSIATGQPRRNQIQRHKAVSQFASAVFTGANLGTDIHRQRDDVHVNSFFLG